MASKREAFLAVERALFHFDQVLHLVDQLDQVGIYMKKLDQGFILSDKSKPPNWHAMLLLTEDVVDIDDRR